MMMDYTNDYDDNHNNGNNVNNSNDNNNIIITTLRPEDVLSGRGSGSNDHIGNICFRENIYNNLKWNIMIQIIVKQKQILHLILYNIYNMMNMDVS